MKQIQPSRDTRYPKIKFGLSWFIVIPAGLWVVMSYYVPVTGGTLNQLQARLVAPIVILLLAFSLYCHVAAHLGAARLTRTQMPSQARILIFGDAAQGWPDVSGWPEIVSAGAGLAVSFLLAGAAYMVWNAQINDFVGDVALLAAGFNAWIFLVNLIPAFPMDGARLVRAGLDSWIVPQQSVNRLLRILGIIVAAAVAGWSIILLAQNARFSVESGAITLLFTVVLLDGLWMGPAQEVEGAVGRNQKTRLKPLRRAGVVLLAAFLFVPPGSLLLMNDGLDAPGLALSTTPMVNVPPAYRHSHPGSFYLLTVISQAPITAGAWVLGQVDPAIQIVPPEFVTPRNTTPQEQARQGYQMLDDSETTAIAVGLRLAGYPTSAVGNGAQVVSILSGSHANGILEAGDIITGLDGSPIHTASDLIALIKTQSPNVPVDLQVMRGSTELHFVVPLMAPASSSDSPKIGIGVQDAGFDFRPPFPVSIVTQKISGGPSAGLMFTLTVYNALTAEDLTGGHKIAGTGTINLDGSVGPIGGVKQKVVAAEGVGASYFLCPADNYADAISVATSIKVIKITTAAQAIAFLRSLPATQ